jgi:hypothetical protein
MTEEVIDRVAEIISQGRYIDTTYIKAFDNENKIYEAMRKPWKKLAIKVLLKLESLGYVQKDPDQSLPENPNVKPRLNNPSQQSTDKYYNYQKAQQDMLKADFVKVRKE